MDSTVAMTRTVSFMQRRGGNHRKTFLTGGLFILQKSRAGEELLLGKEPPSRFPRSRPYVTVERCCGAGGPYKQAVLRIPVPFYLPTELRPSHTANAGTVRVSNSVFY